MSWTGTYGTPVPYTRKVAVSKDQPLKAGMIIETYLKFITGPKDYPQRMLNQIVADTDASVNFHTLYAKMQIIPLGYDPEYPHGKFQIVTNVQALVTQASPIAFETLIGIVVVCVFGAILAYSIGYVLWGPQGEIWSDYYKAYHGWLESGAEGEAPKPPTVTPALDITTIVILVVIVLIISMVIPLIPRRRD